MSFCAFGASQMLQNLTTSFEILQHRKSDAQDDRGEKV